MSGRAAYPPAYQELHTAAANLDMPEETFLRFVARGVLPKPISIGGLERWRWESVTNAWANRTYLYVAESGPFIKIGITMNVDQRMGALRRSSPYDVSLIHWFIGTLKEEAGLHARFAAHCHRSEWFRREGELAAWIEDGCHL